MLENIFISYHFDNDAKEMAEKVRRLVVSHNIKPVTGERLGGESLRQGVKEKIDECQAIIIILTNREQGRTNNWVRDERAYAEGKGLKIITLIESGVNENGMFNERERLRVNTNGNELPILELSETINFWRNSLGDVKKLLIRPKDVSESISNSIGNNTIRYRIWKSKNYRDNMEPNWSNIIPTPEEGGATIYIPGIRSKDLIEIEANVKNTRWGSPAANHNVIVELKKKN